MWVEKKPVYGNQIRVNRGLYYHHGIYASDDCVINFASLIPGHETDPSSASICIVDLNTFLKGGICEVREYDEEELKVIRSPQEVVNYAFSQLGVKGYDLINNNCEHFSYECVFGYKKSDQVNKVADILSNFFKKNN